MLYISGGESGYNTISRRDMVTGETTLLVDRLPADVKELVVDSTQSSVYWRSSSDSAGNSISTCKLGDLHLHILLPTRVYLIMTGTCLIYAFCPIKGFIFVCLYFLLPFTES